MIHQALAFRSPDRFIGSCGIVNADSNAVVPAEAVHHVQGIDAILKVLAVKAFSAVLDFPENSRTSDAQYYKAVSLMKNGQKSDAGAEFKASPTTW